MYYGWYRVNACIMDSGFETSFKYEDNIDDRTRR